MSFPKDYSDPLDSAQRLQANEVADELRLFDDRGLEEYLEFFQNNTVIAGKVVGKVN